MRDINGTLLGLIFGYLVLALGRKNAENFPYANMANSILYMMHLCLVLLKIKLIIVFLCGSWRMKAERKITEIPFAFHLNRECLLSESRVTRDSVNMNSETRFPPLLTWILKNSAIMK